MRIIATLAALLAIASAAFAQDPNRNRMNNPYPETGTVEPVDRAPTPTQTPTPFANRMNVEYGERAPAEMIGGPDPTANRMNSQAPKPATVPEKEAEEKSVR